MMNEFKDDLKLILNVLNISASDTAKELNFDLPTVSNWMNGKFIPDQRSMEDIYSFAYRNNLRINFSYCEPLDKLGKKQNFKVLYHGSISGIKGEINLNLSRKNNDFGKGFYMGESFEQSSIFVCDCYNPHVYAYGLYNNQLKIKEYDVTLDWLLTIAFFRGRLKEYENSKKIKELIEELKNIDIIIAPIADNRMFDIIDDFVEGRINDNACMHAMAALNWGKQYVIKSNKAINSLGVIKEFYLCKDEIKEYINVRNKKQLERLQEIKHFRSEFKKGKYIEEIL